MIVSLNPKPDLSEFKTLMQKTDDILNADALKRPEYYVTRAGTPLEDDVKSALEEAAVGTVFENTIEKISGQRFPDIIAAKLYGVEVKSTKENRWTSTGSSILETTRVSDIERIYMTFGKLGGDRIKFLSKPYEDCLYGIAVTHMPRYLIDMNLSQDGTIFSKIGIPYDELRKMSNPITPVSEYYRKQLKPGESLWWAGNAIDESVSAVIRLWNNVPCEEKKRYKAYGLVNFPEIFDGNYDNYVLWLTSKGIVDSHIRDQFSAGGQERVELHSGKSILLPGVFRRVKNCKDEILARFSLENTAAFNETEKVGDAILKHRVAAWVDTVAQFFGGENEQVKEALKAIFSIF